MVHIGHTGVSKLRSRDPILQGELVNFHVPSCARQQQIEEMIPTAAVRSGLSSPLSKSSFIYFILGAFASQKLDRPQQPRVGFFECAFLYTSAASGLKPE